MSRRSRSRILPPSICEHENSAADGTSVNPAAASQRADSMSNAGMHPSTTHADNNTDPSPDSRIPSPTTGIHPNRTNCRVLVNLATGCLPPLACHLD